MLVQMDLKDDRSEKVHYDFKDYPIYLHRGLLSRYPNYSAPVHWHNDIELIAVLSGEMKYNVNGEIITLRRGEGIFVNAWQMHFGFSDNGTECDFLCILLHPSLLCSASYECDFILPLTRSGTAPFVFLKPDTTWQKRILEHIHNMYKSRAHKTAPLKVQSAFSDIWTLLYENITWNENNADTKNSDLSVIKNMVGLIQQNYARKLSLAQIAAAGAVGTSKCCKLFAKYFGMSPNQYLTHHRLNKSIDLLKNTDYSITEIALSVGFGGASYYAETFRKYFGRSPKEYR